MAAVGQPRRRRGEAERLVPEIVGGDQEDVHWSTFIMVDLPPAHRRFTRMHLTPAMLKRTALGLVVAVPLVAGTIRIVQTNSAGDDVSIIDPATNKVVGVIQGIEVNHGATYAPDGSRYYITNEAESTLDVVDAKTLKVTNHIPLTGHPNNLSITKDGKKVYV